MIAKRQPSIVADMRTGFISLQSLKPGRGMRSYGGSCTAFSGRSAIRFARMVADTQYRGARIQPNATCAEHLEEFEELWNWMTRQWLAKLTEAEQNQFLNLRSETQSDLFRILRNFADLRRKRNRRTSRFLSSTLPHDSWSRFNTQVSLGSSSLMSPSSCKLKRRLSISAQLGSGGV